MRYRGLVPGGGAGGTPADDAFVTAAKVPTGLIGLYSHRDITPTRSFANGGILMNDISGNAEPDVEAIIGGTINEDDYIETVMGPGDLGSLQYGLGFHETGSTFYGIVQTAISAVPESGFYFWRVPHTSNHPAWTGWMAMSGVKGTPNPSATEMILGSDSANVFWNVNGGPAQAGHAHADYNGWMYTYWRRAAGTTFLNTSQVGGTIGDVGSGSSATAWVSETGLRIMFDGAATTNPNREIAAFAVYDNDIGATAFSDIFSAVA